MAFRHVYDQMREIVQRVETRTGMDVFYLYGHPEEIIEKLRSVTRASQEDEGKYPMVALLTDYPQDKGKEGITDVTLQIVIATLTDPNYLAEERVENSLKPILYPIYYALLAEIAKSGYYMVQTQDQIEHRVWDRLYWGRNGLYTEDGNVFEDMIDCIEIEDMKLSAYNHLKC